MSALEVGLETFGDVTKGPGGQKKQQAAVLRDVLAEAELADTLGVDIFSVGEHHRDDFAISTPETLLSAIAARTERISDLRSRGTGDGADLAFLRVALPVSDDRTSVDRLGGESRGRPYRLVGRHDQRR